MSLGKDQWLQKPAAGKYKVHAQGKAHSNFMTSQKKLAFSKGYLIIPLSGISLPVGAFFFTPDFRLFYILHITYVHRLYTYIIGYIHTYIGYIHTYIHRLYTYIHRLYKHIHIHTYMETHVCQCRHTLTPLIDRTH